MGGKQLRSRDGAKTAGLSSSARNQSSTLTSLVIKWQLLLVRDVNLGKAAWGGRIDRCNDLSDMVSDETPSPLTQPKNRSLTVAAPSEAHRCTPSRDC